MTRSARKPAYRPPITQLERIAEAESHIRGLTSTLNHYNRFGQYGVSCRESITRWESVIADAREKIASGWTSLYRPEVVQTIAAREATAKALHAKLATWLRAQGYTLATARALPESDRVALQGQWAAFIASENGE